MNDDELLDLALHDGDCTDAIQERLTAAGNAGGGVVRLPNGAANYRTSGTLTVYPGTSFEGCPGVSVIRYYGPIAAPALRIHRVWNYRLAGLEIRNYGAPQQGHGIEVVPDPADPGPGTGAVSGTCVWDQITVVGFGVGAQLGSMSPDFATCELLFNQTKFVSNDIGIRLNNWNTLNLVCNLINLDSNRIGVLGVEGGRVTVNGGTGGSNSTADFNVGVPNGFSLTGYRSENCHTLLGGANNAVLSNVQAIQKSGATQPLVLGTGSLGVYQSMLYANPSVQYAAMKDCPIYLSNNSGRTSLVVEGGETCGSRPFWCDTDPRYPPTRVYVRGVNKVAWGSFDFVSQWPDFQGCYGSRANPDNTAPPANANCVVDPYRS